MKKDHINVGITDRIARIVIAAMLFSCFVFLPMPTSMIGILGLIPLLTGAAAFCPIYHLLGINTCRLSRR